MREYIKLIFGDADLLALSTSVSKIFDREIKLKKLEDGNLTTFIISCQKNHRSSAGDMNGTLQKIIYKPFQKSTTN